MISNWRKMVGLGEWRSHLVMILVCLLMIVLYLLVDDQWWPVYYFVLWLLFPALFTILGIMLDGSPKLINRIRKGSQLFVPIPVVAISSSFVSSAILISLSRGSNVSDILLYLLFNIWIGLYILMALVVLALIPKKSKLPTKWPSVQNTISMSLVVAEVALVLFLIITGTEMLRLVSLEGV